MRLRVVLGTAVVALGATLEFASAGTAGNARTGGLAFEQVRVSYGSVSSASSFAPPSVDSYDALRAIAADQTKVIAPSTFVMDRSIYEISVSNGRIRAENPSSKRAVIYLPDRRRVIYLDLAAKTFREVDGTAARELLASESPRAADDAPSPPHDTKHAAKHAAASALSKALATGANMSRTVVTKVEQPLPSRVIDGISTIGLLDTATITQERVAGECMGVPDVNATTTSYVDASRAEPFVDGPHLPAGTYKSEASPCLPPFHGNYETSTPAVLLSEAPLVSSSDRFRIYVCTHSVLQQRSTTIIFERGHIRELTDADAGLFDVPGGFVEMKR